MRRKPVDSDRVRAEGQQLAKELNVLELIAIGKAGHVLLFRFVFSCPSFCEILISSFLISAMEK